MDYKKLNQNLSDLMNFRHQNRSKMIENIVEKQIDSYYGEQGETGVSHEIYPWDGNVFIKLTINTDSYGYNEFINGIQFVRPAEKIVTLFLPV